MPDGSKPMSPASYEQMLAMRISEVQSLAGDFGQWANDVSLVLQNVKLKVQMIETIAGYGQDGGQRFIDGYQGKPGYNDVCTTVLDNLQKLQFSLGQVQKGLDDSARTLQHRENQAVQQFGNLLPRLSHSTSPPRRRPMPP